LAEQGGWRMPDDARDLLEPVYDADGLIPVGLADNAQEVDGDTYAKQDAGKFASLRLEGGYRSGPLWDEEARVATRLVDESRTIYLARWQEGQLTAWVDEGHYRWDLSSLRINAKPLQELAPVDDPALQQALADLRDNEKLFDAGSLIVPFVVEEGTWRAIGMTEKGQQVAIEYDTDTGLEIRGAT
ncbi:hypothetical protein, partial [Thiolapillus sp.]